MSQRTANQVLDSLHGNDLVQNIRTLVEEKIRLRVIARNVGNFKAAKVCDEEKQHQSKIIFHYS